MDRYKGFDQEYLRNEFEVWRKKIMKKCNSCVHPWLPPDDKDYCEGWTMDRSIWDCLNDSAKLLIDEAREISDCFCMTEEDIDKVENELKNNAPEDVNILRNVMENPEAFNDDKGVVPKLANVTLNPITGKVDSATDYENNVDEDQPKLSELILGQVRPSYTESTIKTLSETYSITFDDAYKVLKMIRTINEQKPDELYNKLPLPMKQVVEGMIGKDLTEITIAEANETTKELLLQFQSDAEFNEHFVDLEKSIQASYNDAASEIGKIEFTSTREIFTKKLPEEAERLANEGKIEESIKVGEVSLAYCGSYHFNIQFKYLINISQKNKRKVNDTSKFMSVVNTFNEKYKYNTRNIKNIKMLVPILYRRLHSTYPWVTEDLLKKFVILTCLACKDMTPENISDHVYMFYTVQNLAVLDFISTSSNINEWEFASEIINNLLNLLNILRDISRNAKFTVDDFNPYTGYYRMRDFVIKPNKSINNNKESN